MKKLLAKQKVTEGMVSIAQTSLKELKTPDILYEDTIY